MNTREYNQSLANLAENKPILQNTCRAIDILNRFAELCAQAGDGVSADILARKARYLLRYGQNIAEILGGVASGLQEFGLEQL
jgi:hypothetical protein